LACGPVSDDGQAFSSSGLNQSAIERQEWNSLSELSLQVQAARKLQSVASPQDMAQGNVRASAVTSEVISTIARAPTSC
jgi:hypothetical protein